MKKKFNFEGIETCIGLIFILMISALAVAVVMFVIGTAITVADAYLNIPQWLSSLGHFMLYLQ